MNTSGDSVASIVGDLIVLALFVNVAIRMPHPFRRVPWVAIAGAALIGVPSLLQFAVPGISAALARNGSTDWWRVVTALFAQDGGLVAALFNLVVLFFVLMFGEWVWGRWRAIVLFLGPSLILNLLAVYVWRVSGGGSSFASDGLLMSVMGLALVTGGRVLRVLAGAAVVIAVVLVVLNDAHGLAMLIGAALGVIAALLAPAAPGREPNNYSPARTEPPHPS